MPPQGAYAPRNACRSLSPLESTLVDSVATGLQTKYELRRLSDEDQRARYEAWVAIEFRGENPSAMRERTERCFAAMSEMMIGPEGERLTFRLATPSPTTPSTVVRIVREAKEPNSTLWLSSWGCPEIAHETMHLIGGTVDEYVQADEGNKYECRAKGAADSLLVRPHLAFDSAAPVYKWIDCGCDAKDAVCASEVAALKLGAPTACPKSAVATEKKSYRSYERWADDSLVAGETQFVAAAPANHARFVQITEGKNPSLLKPAQFRAIVYPDCTEKNGLYYQCAANAYRDRARGCLASPPECSDGNLAWLFDEGPGTSRPSYPVSPPVLGE